jgi:hypothetical protein
MAESISAPQISLMNMQHGYNQGEISFLKGFHSFFSQYALQHSVGTKGSETRPSGVLSPMIKSYD